MYFKEIEIYPDLKTDKKMSQKCEQKKLIPYQLIPYQCPNVPLLTSIKKSAPSQYSALAQFSDTILLSSIKSLVKEERRIGSEIIEHLFEIDRRSLFSTQGLQSLFDYCVRELGYSEGSAQRRVLAARALRYIPDAGMALKEGKVSVTTLALFQEVVRKMKKNDRSAPKLESIFGLSKLQTEKKLFEMTGVNVKAGIEKKRQISSTQTQITLTLTEVQMKKLELAKGRLAHRLKQHTYAELIELLSEMAIEKTTPKPPAQKRKKKDGVLVGQSVENVKVDGAVEVRGGSDETKRTTFTNSTSLAKLTQQTNSTSLAKQTKLNTRYISQTVKAKIWQKSAGKCEKCKSTYALQIDHKVPYSLSLNSGAENLRILCRTCNLAEAKCWGIARPEIKRIPIA